MEKDKPIIDVRNISKKYDIKHMHGGYVALRDVLMNVLKSPFSFLKSKAKQAAGLDKKEEFWALKGVSFQVKKGEVIGIIGANGAGKSTLLKILSQITPPTEGEIILRGRVGSLLEVGTGFHPELSGRENIFLNGAILGMKKKEIENKFNQIVEFAGIEKFLDTPVKYYSSGMYVRLAFSVAAHMEPDILVVDEVLAVGDAEFQKKCLGKMDEITKSEGRTILFVSHNMGAIQSLCDRCILIDKGQVKKMGKTEDIIDLYLSKVNKGTSNIGERTKRKGNGWIRATETRIKNKSGELVSSIQSGEDMTLEIDYVIEDDSAKDFENFEFVLTIWERWHNVQVAHLSTKTIGKSISTRSSSGTIVMEINKLALNTGPYSFNTWIEHNGLLMDWVMDAGTFNIIFGDYYGHGVLPPEKYAISLLDYDVREK